MLFQSSLRLLSFNFFFPVCSADWLFYIFLSSSSLMHSSVLLSLLFIPSSVFISATELFMIMSFLYILVPC